MICHDKISNKHRANEPLFSLPHPEPEPEPEQRNPFIILLLYYIGSIVHLAIREKRNYTAAAAMEISTLAHVYVFMIAENSPYIVRFSRAQNSI